MAQCALTVLAKPRTAPIRCRRKVWELDPESQACYTCHPRGREQAIELVVRQVLGRQEGQHEAAHDGRQADQRENKRGNRRAL